MQFKELPPKIPMGRAKDITNQKFNLLTPLFRVKGNNDRVAYFACKCDCGEYTVVKASHIKDGHTKSCGCLDHPNLAGKKFGKLTVIERSNEKGTGAIWECQCDCGKITYVRTQDLMSGHSKSCGCQQTEKQEQDLLNKKFGKLTCLYATNKRSTSGGIIWHCKCDCGNEIDVERQSLITGNTSSCGCIISKGEEKIRKILLNANISFETQKTFETCRFPDTKRLAKFDFYLPNYNILIEYDGKQHFTYQNSDKSWNNKENFEKTVKRDQYKNQWCKKNNITLIRIPYTDYDKISIEYIFNKKAIFG
jgi:very-short-patch-repair endonuclease